MDKTDFSALELSKVEADYGKVGAALWWHLAGDWQRSHRLVQSEQGEMACWLHALLHKIEGDEQNSRYWYSQCPVDYQDYQVGEEEQEILTRLAG